MDQYGFVKVAAAVPELRVADIDFNIQKIKELILEAEKRGVKIICFPELSVTGYTCGDLFFQKTLINKAQAAILQMVLELKGELDTNLYYVFGTPALYQDKLYNVAVVCYGETILGLVPKTYIPNNNEFYETRWFNALELNTCVEVDFGGKKLRMGTNTVFGSELGGFAVELCEDLWAPIPPSCTHTQNGARIILNLSASNELIGKNNYRSSLISQQSARTNCAYIYASAGCGESTTDLVFAGNAYIYENGKLLAKSERFSLDSQLIVSDIDCELLASERLRNTSFRTLNDNYFKLEEPIALSSGNAASFDRKINAYPFIPSPESYHESCEEIFSIQIGGLAKRLLHTHTPHVVVGISGGLDSTLALLVCAKTFDKLGRDRKDIIGVTMPGFGTSGRTYHNAVHLMQSLGVTIREINIAAACNQHFADIGHNPSVHDVTYENTQARERTQILMDIANQVNGLVIGTGDLSELALGWATYNGDHMSMYGVNSGIPKTLVRHLVRWVAEIKMDADSRSTLLDIIDTPVSPELIPHKENGEIAQITEDIVGPYELHDFFLYHLLRYGFTPNKVLFLARNAFSGIYEEETIRHWLKIFYRRFFNQQFKRSCMPDGPKVGSVNLSPRGDWRMPSDACSTSWLEDL